MRRSSWLTFSLVIMMITLQICILQCDARGGRGRGGGSFGGIFGGWRKHKKVQPSNSNSRRTSNSSPPQYTSNIKTVSSGSSSYSSFSNTKQQQTKPQASYPKQQMPLGGSAYNNYGGNYHGSGGAGAYLPPGSTYYPNTGAIPQGAIFYAQPPQRSGNGDFLMGMLAGHMTSNMLFGSHHHVYQHYYHEQNRNGQNNPKIIVINNGTASILNLNDTTQTTIPNSEHYWPTDSDTPLEPFNTSVTPEDAMKPGKEPIFQRVKFNNFQTTQMTPTAGVATGHEQQQQHDYQQQGQEKFPTPPPLPPVNGIICMPILLNETDPNDPTKMLQVERTICFPAPPPPSEALIEPANVNCVTRTFIETDPNDPTQTIEVPREICTTTTSTLTPPQVAGEIVEIVASETEKTTSEIEKFSKEDDGNDDGDVDEDNGTTEEIDSSIETTTEGKFIRSLTTKSAAFN